MRRADLWRSLRIRIIAFIAAILAAGAVLLGLAAWQSAKVAAEAAYDRLLTGGAVEIAGDVYVQGGVVTLDPPATAIATMSAYDRVYYKVVDPRGLVVAGYGDLVSLAPAAETRHGVVLENGRYRGEPVRVATISRRIAGGWATIIVAQTVNARRELADSLTVKALGIIAVMSALSLIAAALSVRLALSPLTRIEREIAARRPDDLSPIRAAPPPEVRTLVAAIDDFMRRLASRIAVMQRFIADAAHQIRTPLAALDAQVELLEDAKDAAGRAEHIARIRARAAELGRLTGQLLGHAMVIHRAEAAVPVPVELNDLAKSVLAHAVPLSLDREVDIVFCASPEAPVVDGDPVSLREAVANLIGNALLHGARTQLSVSVGTDGSLAWVEVADDGEGIDPAEAERLLQPFERGPGGPTGSGLGLAIAAEVARAHGGALSFGKSGGLFTARLSALIR